MKKRRERDGKGRIGERMERRLNEEKKYTKGSKGEETKRKKVNRRKGEEEMER